jgi:hypothetical protein
LGRGLAGLDSGFYILGAIGGRRRNLSQTLADSQQRFSYVDYKYSGQAKYMGGKVE